MAEKPKSLLVQPARGALAEGAARFEHLIQTVKTQHAQPEENPAPAPNNPLLAVSPQEEWSRQFQSLGIGPERRGLALSDLAPLPRAMFMPERAPMAEVVPTRTSDIAPRAAPSAIGAGLGKPQRPRRSWLGRLLARS